MILKLKSIYLKLAQETDAGFILSLRTNSTLNKHLSFVDDSLAEQEEWLKKYKIREKSNLEFYFIICRIKDNLPVGTARIYDFIGIRDSFCWGSWILNNDKPKFAALETIILVFDFAFQELKFKRCHIDFKKNNKKVIDFHLRIGMQIYLENEDFVYGYIYPDQYYQHRDKIISKIYSIE